MATSGCAFDSDHRLWAFCDAPIHWKCFIPWSDRVEFANAYFEGQFAWWQGNPVWHLIQVDPSWFAVLHPRSQQLFLIPRASGVSVAFSSQSWPHATDLDAQHASLIGAELQQLKSTFPDWNSLYRDFDPATYEKGLVAYEVRRQDELEAHQRALEAELAPHREQCAQMVLQLQAGQLWCPTCQKAHGQIRFYDRSPDRKSIFICQICAFSFGPEGMPDWRK